MGRPPALTTEDEAKFWNTLADQDLKERSATKKNADGVFVSIARARREERNQPTLGFTPSTTTGRKYLERSTDVRAHPKTKPERRLAAEGDIRNFTSLCAVLRAMYGEGELHAIKDYNFYNTDVTTVVLCSEGATFEKVYIAAGIAKVLRDNGQAVTRATKVKPKFLRIKNNMTTSATGQLVATILSKKGRNKAGVTDARGIKLPGLKQRWPPTSSRIGWSC
jgi:hypothetical protein